MARQAAQQRQQQLVQAKAPTGRAAERARRRLGQYYTTSYNPFLLRPFREWAAEARLGEGELLEPFAGANHLVSMLREAGWAGRYASYDLRPGHPSVMRRDSIADFPPGHRSCVSNPPWLGRSSAARRRIPYPDTPYDDLYKHCLSLALGRCENVAFLVPASFLHSRLFRERLDSVVFLHRLAFDGTENPVCLAMFRGEGARSASVWHDDERIGDLASLERHMPAGRQRVAARLRFNDPRGGLGLVCIDDTRAPTIRFCRGADLPHAIRHSSRTVTRIGGIRAGGAVVERLNGALGAFRAATRDVFLTPFKGLRNDGEYRRRLDYGLARRLISEHAE